MRLQTRNRKGDMLRLEARRGTLDIGNWQLATGNWQLATGMKHLEKAAPIGAAVTALTTLLCCLPPVFAAAAATASLSAVVMPLQPWLLGGSLGLLLVGVLQLWIGRRTCAIRGSSSAIVLTLCAAIVLLVVFFPQAVAAFIADWLPGTAAE